MKKIRGKLTAYPQKGLAFKNSYASGRENEISVFLSAGMQRSVITGCYLVTFFKITLHTKDISLPTSLPRCDLLYLQ